MSKPIKRWILVNLYDIVGIETWLSELSSQGLAFEKFGRFFAHFHRCEPREMIYRLEPLSRPEKPDTEMLEFYQQSGWEYVCDLNGLFSVFRALPGTNEIHTDPVAQGYAFERLNQKLKTGVIIMGILVTLIVAMISAVYFTSDWLVLSLVQNQSLINQSLLILLELGLLYNEIYNYRSIHRLMLRLKSGLPLVHTGKPRRKKVTSFYLFINAVAVCSIIASVMSNFSRTDTAIAAFESPLPLLPLSSIESGEGFAYRNDLFQGKEYGNRVESSWSVFAPAQYDIDQSGEISGRLWSDQSGDYSPSLQTMYYRLLIPAMAGPLMDDLVYRYTVHRYMADELTETELSAKGLDEVRFFISDNVGTQILFARRDNQVIMLRYYGEEDFSKQIHVVAALLDSWPDQPQNQREKFMVS